MARTRNPLSIDPEREHRVRERAYLMWEADGKLHGRDVEYWERARELVGREETAGSSEVENRQSENSARLGRVEETEVQDNPSKLLNRTADQGEVKTSPAPKRKSRAKAKKT